MRKTKINKGLLAMTVFASGFLSSANVFAANPYNIDYTGGAELGASNVIINKPLIDGLTPLIKDSDGSNLSFSTSGKWNEGYVSWGDNLCDKIRYITISDGENIGENDNISYTITGNKYASSISIKSAITEDLTSLLEGGNKMAVGVNEANGWLFVGFGIYTEKNTEGQCVTDSAVENIIPLRVNNGGKIFVKANIKINEKNSTTQFTSDELYFGITDIDQAQSYKILNSGSKLSSNNMYAVSANSLQPTADTSGSEFKNMFVGNNNYIYSEYDASKDPSISNANSNIFVKIDTDTQEEGLDMVYGFARSAGSGINYYAKQYVVNYKSDDNGKITGIKNENVISGLNPLGSTETPNDGYTFEYWTANVDVTLKDGTTIAAGKKLTSEQIKNVVVHSDITFTAINKDKGIIAPDTGTMTEEDVNNTFIMGLVFPIGMLAAMAGTYIVNRKKHAVSFKK